MHRIIKAGRLALPFDLSNRFLYNQYVQAAYGLYANTHGKFSYQLGLRAEQTALAGDQRASGEQFAQHYFDLFPAPCWPMRFRRTRACSSATASASSAPMPASSTRLPTARTR